MVQNQTSARENALNEIKVNHIQKLNDFEKQQTVLSQPYF